VSVTGKHSVLGEDLSMEVFNLTQKLDIEIPGISPRQPSSSLGKLIQVHEAARADLQKRVEALEEKMGEISGPLEDKLQDMTQECHSLARQVDKYDKSYRQLLGDQLHMKTLL